MTLFLIVALIVLVISFSQAVDNKYTNTLYRQSTITNVKLERQLKDEWRGKIDKRIDELTLPFNVTEYSCLCVLKIKDNDISLTVAFPASEDNPEEIVRYIVSDDNFDNCITGGFELTDEEKITLLISLFKKLA